MEPCRGVAMTTFAFLDVVLVEIFNFFASIQNEKLPENKHAYIVERERKKACTKITKGPVDSKMPAA